MTEPSASPSPAPAPDTSVTATALPSAVTVNAPSAGRFSWSSASSKVSRMLRPSAATAWSAASSVNAGGVLSVSI